MGLTSEDTWAFVPQLIAIASKAGEAIMEIYHSGFSISFKDDHSPVTEADMRASAIIVDGLRKITPGIPIICEETAELPFQVRRQYDQVWIVDPLDGTKEFIRKNDEFAVNIALIEDSRPMAGIIFAPVTRHLYYAVKGMGAWKQGGGSVPERLSPKFPDRSRQRMNVAVSSSHLSAEDVAYIEKLRMQYPEMQTVPVGSSLKFGLLAEGKVDIYPKFGYTMEWDTASGQIILEEAGAELYSTETGQPLHYNKENLRNPYFIAKHKDLSVSV